MGLISIEEFVEKAGFEVTVNKYGTSPSPAQSIWLGQHTCVCEGNPINDPVPDPERCEEIIIKHQLASDRGHYSVLQHAYFAFHCHGFPHEVIAQITRHQGSNPLVQSNRYTGQRFQEYVQGNLSFEDVFYVRPAGRYKSRDGVYDHTPEMVEKQKEILKLSAQYYADLVENHNCPPEDARNVLGYAFRQEFAIASRGKDLWHWLDQRTKADSQFEIQVLAYLVFKEFEKLCPGLAGWYKKNRYGKAMLAP